MERAHSEIAVLGAGPAGAAAALGLAALGYAVVVIAPGARERRRHESFSARSVAALRGLGLDASLAAVGSPGERVVRWAGEERVLPGEALVERAAFDAGLLADLERRGVRILRSEVASVAEEGVGVRVTLRSGETLEARFAVEARGRAAPGNGARERGPETVCVLQHWRRGKTGPAAASRVAIASLGSGWCWLADDGGGEVSVQLALDAADAPTRDGLGDALARALRSDPWCDAWLGDATPPVEPTARAATAVISGACVSRATLRVGDAALAVDPLSGNGVFQALSSALVAPAVVNTLLQRPERAELARAFYAERTRDVFTRFARVSRDFYALGAAHHGGAFWRARAAWPDAKPAHTGASNAPGQLTITRRPVVLDGWIEEREVVLTTERPLGVWQVAGVEVAPLVRGLSMAKEARAPTGDALAAVPEPARAAVAAWLRAQAML
jgi:flavin-dependent dehydrogenase